MIRALLGTLVAVAGCGGELSHRVLSVPQASLQLRQLQSRRYDTTEEKFILSAVLQTLQDMGYSVDEAEPKLGVLVASRQADARDQKQYALATTLALLNAFSGTPSSSPFEGLDHVQKIRASVVTQPTQKGRAILVRLTLQRIVWDREGHLTRMETLSQPQLYQGFFERLNKAVFLEGHAI